LINLPTEFSPNLCFTSRRIKINDSLPRGGSAIKKIYLSAVEIREKRFERTLRGAFYAETRSQKCSRGDICGLFSRLSPGLPTSKVAGGISIGLNFPSAQRYSVLHA